MPVALTQLNPASQSPDRNHVTGPLLVATDGRSDADGAMALAWSLAGQTGADVQVIGCATPFDATGELQAMKPAPDERWRARRDLLLAAIRAQMKRTLPAECSWPVTVVAGYGGEDIAAFARSMRAPLIIMGRGRHGMMERIAQPEEVLRVLQLADVPVLAVEADATAAPRRIVVATDFSPYSTHAGRLALQYAAPDAVVYLAHVRPRIPATGAHVAEWEQAYEAALPTMFTAARDALAPAGGQVVETIELTGEVGFALREFATQCKADAIVSATHGRGFFDRFVLGSVAVDLLRHAPCSFLCVPGAALDRRLAPTESLGQRAALATAELPATLKEFSARNEGRACTIELSRPEDGPQVLAVDRPFVRALYDQASGALTIVVGTLVGAIPEHTHILSSVRAVDRLVGASDGDLGLLVDDGDAGMLRLTFSS